MNMQYIVRQPLALLLPAFFLLLALPGCGGLGKMEKAIEELNLKMDPERSFCAAARSTQPLRHLPREVLRKKSHHRSPPARLGRR